MSVRQSNGALSYLSAVVAQHFSQKEEQMKRIRYGRSGIGFERVKRSYRRFCAMVALLFAVALPAFGSTITVTTTNDSGPGSLRAALASAVSGDLINFNLQYPATIVVASPLKPGHGVTILGPGPNSLAINGGDGVSVFVVQADGVVINGLTIEHGSSVLGAGVLNEGTLTLVNVVISNNTVGTQLGAGIFNSGTLTLTVSTVSGNSASSASEQNQGGGIYNYQGTLTITFSDISSNEAAPPYGGRGGGIAVHSGTVNVDQSTIAGNTAQIFGAGIYIEGGQVNITRSTVSGNTSPNAGGGIVILGGTLALTNSTIANNVAAGYAGILATQWPDITPVPSVFLSNSTVYGNNPSGLNIGENVAAAVKNSIFHGNYGNNCFNSFGAILSQGYNLSSDVSCNLYFTQTGDVNHADIGLDPNGLQDNGGLTQTVALVSTSSAINAIPVSACTDVNNHPVTTDQRDVPRPQGSACDIGAFEYFQSQHLVQAVQTYQIIGAVYALSLPSGIQSSLTAPLQGAIDSLNRGDLSSASGQLGAFIYQANALMLSGRLTSTKASPLIAAAQSVLGSINGG